MRTRATMLALLLAFLLSVADRPLGAQTQAPPFVVVQAVDPHWLPVPGAVVQLRELRGTRTVRSATTNADGAASFRFDPPDGQQSFDITVTMAGFKDAALKNVRFGSCQGDCPSTRYVQVRLDLPGLGITIR